MRQIGASAAKFKTLAAELETRLIRHIPSVGYRSRSDLDSEVPTGTAKVAGRLAQPALPLGIWLSVGCLVEGMDEAIGDPLRRRPRANCTTRMTVWSADHDDVARGVSLHLRDVGRLLRVERSERRLDNIGVEPGLRLDLVDAHDLTRLFIELNDRPEHGRSRTVHVSSMLPFTQMPLTKLPSRERWAHDRP